MLSSVLNSERAIQVNIQIMRIFVKIRKMLSANQALKKKIEEVDRKHGKQIQKHEAEIRLIFHLINELSGPVKRTTKKIGFAKLS